MAHILVIDDEADIRFMLTEFLTHEGHTVDTAENGKAGVRLAGQHHYDLIITDIIMPEMDGIEVLSSIKQNFPDMRIIVMTGGTLKMEKGFLLSMARAMKAQKVIAKPLNFKELQAAVNEILAT
jgi:DNA-binding response OmpR family regulator